jgi:hypothetical protein
MQVMQGAVPAVGNAFRAGFGNDEAYNRLKAQAAGPNIQQGLKDWGQTFSALGQTAKTVPGNFVRAAVNNPENKLSIINKYTGIGDKGAKYVDDTVNNLFKPNQQVAGGGALSKAYSALPAPIKAVASGVSDATTAAGQGIAQGVANKLTQAEGGRMAANYALPIVDFFRNNPWAKWALGGAAALGAYGLGRSLFGSEDYDEENAPQTLFNQGYGKVYQPRALRVSE